MSTEIVLEAGDEEEADAATERWLIVLTAAACSVLDALEVLPCRGRRQAFAK